MTKTEIQLIWLIALPIIGMAVAWGNSLQRLNTLEQNELKFVNANQIEVIKVEIEYIKERQDTNQDLLLEILDKISP
jgi:hypothetical protein